MKRLLVGIGLLFSSLVFAAPFTEPNTGMTLEIPDTFFSCEDFSYTSSCPYWYTFADAEGSILSIEIDEYEHSQTLSEHFHKTMTDSDFLEEKSLVCEQIEFRNLQLEALDLTKLKVRLLALTEEGADPLYFCDYLFVKEQFGITIGITKKEVGPDCDADTEQMMLEILKSITFES